MTHSFEASLLSIYQVQSAEIAPGVVLDYNEHDHVVGIEMLRQSKHAPDFILSTHEFTTG